MSDIYQTITEFVRENPGEDRDSLANRIYQTVSKKDLWPLLADAIGNRLRNDTRTVELQAFKQLAAQRASSPAGFTVGDMEPFKALFGKSFRDGNGFSYEWGYATVEEHRARLEMLYKKRSGLDETIARHESAIALIESTGTSCLVEALEAAA